MWMGWAEVVYVRMSYCFDDFRNGQSLDYVYFKTTGFEEM